MKKLMLLLALVGCQKENIQPQPVLDCECDRVVEINSFNMPSGSEFGNYITINDCTGVQRNHSFSNSNDKPFIGQCK